MANGGKGAVGRMQTKEPLPIFIELARIDPLDIAAIVLFLKTHMVRSWGKKYTHIQDDTVWRKKTDWSIKRLIIPSEDECFIEIIKNPHFHFFHATIRDCAMIYQAFHAEKKKSGELMQALGSSGELTMASFHFLYELNKGTGRNRKQWDVEKEDYKYEVMAKKLTSVAETIKIGMVFNSSTRTFHTEFIQDDFADLVMMEMLNFIERKKVTITCPFCGETEIRKHPKQIYCCVQHGQNFHEQNARDEGRRKKRNEYSKKNKQDLPSEAEV